MSSMHHYKGYPISFLSTIPFQPHLPPHDNKRNSEPDASVPSPALPAFILLQHSPSSLWKFLLLQE